MVSVSNVAAAIAFFIDSKDMYNDDIFIISDDESLNNNYRYLEKAFLNALNSRDYPFPIIAAPLFTTKILLRLAGKSNINPDCVYNCQKILNEGFIKPHSFEDELASFLLWYEELYK